MKHVTLQRTAHTARTIGATALILAGAYALPAKADNSSVATEVIAQKLQIDENVQSSPEFDLPNSVSNAIHDLANGRDHFGNRMDNIQEAIHEAKRQRDIYQLVQLYGEAGQVMVDTSKGAAAINKRLKAVTDQFGELKIVQGHKVLARLDTAKDNLRSLAEFEKQVTAVANLDTNTLTPADQVDRALTFTGAQVAAQVTRQKIHDFLASVRSFKALDQAEQQVQVIAELARFDAESLNQSATVFSAMQASIVDGNGWDQVLALDLTSLGQLPVIDAIDLAPPMPGPLPVRPDGAASPLDTIISMGPSKTSAAKLETLFEGALQKEIQAIRNQVVEAEAKAKGGQS